MPGRFVNMRCFDFEKCNERFDCLAWYRRWLLTKRIEIFDFHSDGNVNKIKMIYDIQISNAIKTAGISLVPLFGKITS